MFWDIFTKLCKERGLSPSGVCRRLGISSALATAWKNGAKPSAANAKKLADYFEISVGELLGEEPAKQASNIDMVFIPTSMSADEQEVLRLYRAVPVKDKGTLLAVLGKFANE